MKRTLAVKKGESQLRVELDRLDAKYRKVKDLLAQALSHRHRFELAVRAVAIRDGTCWCGVGIVKLSGRNHLMHTVECDTLHFVLYDGRERGEIEEDA